MLSSIIMVAAQPFREVVFLILHAQGFKNIYLHTSHALFQVPIFKAVTVTFQFLETEHVSIKEIVFFFSSFLAPRRNGTAFKFGSRTKSISNLKSVSYWREEMRVQLISLPVNQTFEALIKRSFKAKRPESLGIYFLIWWKMSKSVSWVSRNAQKRRCCVSTVALNGQKHFVLSFQAIIDQFLYPTGFPSAPSTDTGLVHQGSVPGPSLYYNHGVRHSQFCVGALDEPLYQKPSFHFQSPTIWSFLLESVPLFWEALGCPPKKTESNFQN